MVCAPVRRDNPRALESGLSTVQAHKTSSFSLVPSYPVETLYVMGYLVLKIWVSGHCGTIEVFQS